jgi:hypothetical protein
MSRALKEAKRSGPTADPTDYRSGASNKQYKRQRANYDATRVADDAMTTSDYIVKHGKEPEKRY